MKVTDLVREVELEMAESQNQKDARVEGLWKRLDYQGKGELDWRGLQKGLRKIDHRQLKSPGSICCNGRAVLLITHDSS
jgi:solute carrier family 25 (mitochondrial phosphate transporter), member 23/24/25/41